MPMKRLTKNKPCLHMDLLIARIHKVDRVEQLYKLLVRFLKGLSILQFPMQHDKQDLQHTAAFERS